MWSRNELDRTQQLTLSCVYMCMCGKVKDASEKVGLKLNIQKMKIMASDRITSWEVDEEIVETLSDLIFWGSKITADGDCSHETKRPSLEVKL